MIKEELELRQSNILHAINTFAAEFGLFACADAAISSFLHIISIGFDSSNVRLNLVFLY